MDTKMLFGSATLCVITIAYLILNRGIYITRGKGQNSFTWALWGVLDLILYFKIKEEDGLSAMLALGCVIGSLFTSLHLFKYKKEWTKNENRTLYFIGVIVLMMIFSFSAKTIIIIAVIAEMVSGWPLMVDTWKNPDNSGYTLMSYLVFLLGYFLNVTENYVLYPNQVFGDKFVENMLFPIAFIIFSFFDTLPLVIAWLRRK